MIRNEGILDLRRWNPDLVRNPLIKQYYDYFGSSLFGFELDMLLLQRIEVDNHLIVTNHRNIIENRNPYAYSLSFKTGAILLMAVV